MTLSNNVRRHLDTPGVGNVLCFQDAQAGIECIRVKRKRSFSILRNDSLVGRMAMNVSHSVERTHSKMSRKVVCVDALSAVRILAYEEDPVVGEDQLTFRE